MDVRTTSFAYPCSTRGLTRDVPFTRSSRRSRREQNRCVVRVAAPGDYGADGEEKTPTEESSRRKLEVVTGLLREGYGVGAILTAAAFRGASVATEILKGVANGAAAARRQRTQPIPRLTKKRTPSIVEQFQKTVEEYMTTSVPREKTKLPVQTTLKCEMQSQDASDAVNRNLADQSLIMGSQTSDVETRAENLEIDEWMRGYKEALGIPSEESLSSKHIDRLLPSMWLHSIDDRPELVQEAMLSEDVELGEMEIAEETSDGVSAADVEFVPSQEMEMADTTGVVDDPKPEVEADVTVDGINAAEGDSNVTLITTESLSASQESTTAEMDTFIDASDVIQGLDQFEASEDSMRQLQEKTTTDNVEDVDVLEDVVKSAPISEETMAADPNSVPAKDNILLENNVETFEKPSSEETSPEESSTAVNEALDILDKIANFEMEESVDDDDGDDPVPKPVSVVVQKSKKEAEDDVRRQMEAESKRRLKAMKLQNEARQRRRPDAPVKVERPSSGPPSQMSGISPPTQQLKGLDYIKSYAKEKQEHEQEEASNEMTSSFFKPPSILQVPKKQKTQMVAGPTRAYSQWNEIDRLKKVREIGTVMWVGKDGGGNDDSSGGSGGSGGGKGGSNGKRHNPDDGHWWIQVGVSMMTMTALVFALLMAISNQLERQNQRKAKSEAK